MEKLEFKSILDELIEKIITEIKKLPAIKYSIYVKQPIPDNDKIKFDTEFDAIFKSNNKVPKQFIINKASFNSITLQILNDNFSQSDPSRVLTHLHIFFIDDNYFDNSKIKMNLLFRFSNREKFKTTADLYDMQGDKIYLLDNTNLNDKTLFFLNNNKFEELLRNFKASQNSGDEIMTKTQPIITEYITYEFSDVLKHYGFGRVSQLVFDVILIKCSGTSCNPFYAKNNNRLSLAVKVLPKASSKTGNDEYFDFGELNP